MSKLDKLFKEELADHVDTPPVGTWLKVETELSKKNKAVVWMHWAAVFLLGALLFTAFWLNEKETPERVTNESTRSPFKKEKEIQKSSQSTLTEANTKKKKVNKAPVMKKEDANSETPQVLTEPEVKEEVAQLTVEPASQGVQAESVVTGARKPIVLVYTLDPVDSPPGQTVATASDKKDSSIKKVMEFALNIKNSDPLSELRVMKEDLFALDLKKKTTSKKQ